ncbi:hypothetical protein KJ059_02765 [Myxococcota bacterium]|nr:hypothetical protein [Myxococcota bacterium]
MSEIIVTRSSRAGAPVGTLAGRRIAGIFFGIAAAVLASACTPAGIGGAPVVWPKAARLGDTVAMSIDSNRAPFFGPLVERYDLSEENVTLEIRQGTTSLATVSPRAVFDGLSAPASIRNRIEAGSFLTVGVFDIPASLPVSPPVSTTVVLLVDGVATLSGTLEIIGSGGSPMTFIAESQPADLGSRPVLRLQGRAAGPGVDGFDPAWVVGAIEFRLEYPAAAVSEPDVFPATEASRALAFSSTEDPPGSVRVVLTDPRGFVLPSTPGYPEGNRVGEGPLIDVVFTKAPSEAFAAGDFTVRDLAVFDPDGVRLTPVFPPGTDTTDYFVRIARKNLAE